MREEKTQKERGGGIGSTPNGSEARIPPRGTFHLRGGVLFLNQNGQQQDAGGKIDEIVVEQDI